MRERFDGSPFKYPLVWRNFNPNHLGPDGNGQWTIGEAKKVIRRMPLYKFDKDPMETISRIKQVYGEFGSYPNLHVPSFDVIRGGFDYDDARRFQPYLLVVDLIEGNNLSDITFSKSERKEAKVDLELFWNHYWSILQIKFQQGVITQMISFIRNTFTAKIQETEKREFIL